jgi:hypothetical protein
MLARLAPALLLPLVVAGSLVVAGCPSGPQIGSRTTVLNTKPSVFLRATPDGDASEIIGAFLPDDIPDAQVDESSAVRTRCSNFIKPKRVPASGEYQEVAAASSGAAGKIGVKSIAKVDMGGETAEALLVRYTLIEKMQADVDEDNLQRCCAEAPDQCTKRFISSALMADGNYYAATEAGSNVGADSQALKNLPVDASIVYESDMKWERKVNFKRQYFAFSTRRSLAKGLASTSGDDAGKKAEPAGGGNDCKWANEVPTDLDGQYFVGVSNPMPTEKLAREDAMRDARDQVIKYLGEFLSEAQVSAQRTTGSAADLTVLLEDAKVKESMSAGLARSVKDRKWCGPTEQGTPSGTKSLMKVLAYFPNAERKAASVVALRSVIEKQKAAGQNTAALEAMLKSLEAQP